jgi:hypothetical protein
MIATLRSRWVVPAVKGGVRPEMGAKSTIRRRLPRVTLAGPICEAVGAGARPVSPECPAVKTLAALLLGMVTAPLTAGAGSPDPVSVVRRSTLLVHDMEASVRFYRDVLGFEVWLQNSGTVGPNSLPSEAPLGAPSRHDHERQSRLGWHDRVAAVRRRTSTAERAG